MRARVDFAFTIAGSPRLDPMTTKFIAHIYAHPLAERSLANQELLDALGDLPFVFRRNLYDLYPDFDIDVEAERALLESVDLIVLQHPVYWYSMPALLKLWIDEVFGLGWAYGSGGTALVGKQMLWIVTTGGDFRAYSESGPHRHPFDVFIAPVRQTAHFCGMHWQEPLVIHDAHSDRTHVQDAGLALRARLMKFAGATHAPKATPVAREHSKSTGR
jgi:glutathione-regulated potassium-efflux system ancillary protein KefF